MARKPRKKGAHGGKRRGAGAPLGNLNGYKHGGRSRQVAAMREALEFVPRTAAYVGKVTGRDPVRLELFARALSYYADMLLLIARGRPIKNMRGLQLHPDNLFELLIKQSSAAAKREMDIEGDRASS